MVNIQILAEKHLSHSIWPAPSELKMLLIYMEYKESFFATVCGLKENINIELIDQKVIFVILVLYVSIHLSEYVKSRIPS